jgi:hypothetical protein
VNPATISRLAQWALDKGVPDDLNHMADDLRTYILDPDRVADDTLVDDSGFPAPLVGAGTGVDHLHDAVCLLLMRYLSPAREGDPVLLSSLLDLAAELRLPGAREIVAGLLVGGAYRGIAGPAGPIEPQMIRTLRDVGLADAGDDPIRKLLHDLLEEPDAVAIDISDHDEPDEPAAPTRLTGDQVPQVNDLDQVFAFVDAVRRGVANRRDFARFSRVSVRQADFVARAAASLDLVAVHPGGEYALTDLGTDLPPADDASGRDLRHTIVGRHPLLRSLDLEDTDALPELPQLERLLAAQTELGPGTIRRRAQALKRWVEWWASGGR